MADRKCLLSFGHGYSARALASLLIPRGWTVIGTTRTAEKAEQITKTGAEAVIWPDGPADLRQYLERATHLLTSAGPDEDGDPVLRGLGDDIAKLAESFNWAGYLSTTGVYGDHRGAWVDETTTCTPSTKRGQWRLQAEQDWSAIPGLPIHIFRLAGIYGPGRGPFSKVRNGTARRIIKQGQVFSRIHVEDIATVLEASIAKPRPGAIYNVNDDLPAPPEDVLDHAAQLLGKPSPPAVAFEDADLHPMAKSFYSECKRTKNDLLSQELGVDLKYPTYREGLAALLEGEV
ncbi:MAG: SDR family oxidoreductase [Pseudomonadota bacterium]